MQHLQTSLFYDLQELIRNSTLLRKYYYLFKALNLSTLPDKNYGIGRTGHSRHAILRAFIVKHLERIKSVPQLIEYLQSYPALLEMCGFELGNLPIDRAVLLTFGRQRGGTNHTLLINRSTQSDDDCTSDRQPHCRSRCHIARTA